MQSRNVVRYINNWNQIQVKVELFVLALAYVIQLQIHSAKISLSGHTVRLDSKANLWLLLSFAFSTMLVIFALFQPSKLRVGHVLMGIAYGISLLHQMILCVWWMCSCKTLCQLSNYILEEFKVYRFDNV
jgi:hypothetical protein